MNWRFWQRECSNCKRYEEGLARLKSLNFQANETDPMIVDAAFDGAAVKLFAASAVHWFKETGGQNFVTLDMSDPRTGEHYQVTMQKAGGMTPAQKIEQLEKQLRAVSAAAEGGK
jgi:hypothetical protein